MIPILIICSVCSIAEPLVFDYTIDEMFETIESGKVLSHAVFPFPSNEEMKSGFSFTLTPGIFFGKINESVPRDRYSNPIDPSENFYVYEKTPPFMTMSFDLGNDVFKLHVDYPLKREYVLFHERNITNIPITVVDTFFSIDLNFPQNAYGVFDLENQYFVIGRCKLKWGDAEYPVALSDTSPYFDNFTYSFLGDKVHYTFHFASINPVLTADEYASQTSVIPVNSDPTASYFTKVKTLVGHRLDFFPLENLRLGIGELTMIGGKFPDLFTISPFIVYHNNFNEGYANSMGVFDFSWTPIPGLNFHGELALDDLVIKLTESDVKPTAFAFNIGVRKTVWTTLGNILIGAEYVKATDFVYNSFTPYLKFYNRITYLSNFPPSRNIVDYPIGFSYGPDSSLFSLKIDYYNEEITLELELFSLLKGPNTIHTEYGVQEQGETKRINGMSFSISYKGANVFFEGIGGKRRIGVVYRWAFK